MAHKVFSEDHETARKIGLESCQIIKQAYAEKPIFFCGKTAKGIVSGLFYLLSFKHKLEVTKRELAEALEITEATIRYSVSSWTREFPEVASARTDFYYGYKVRLKAEENQILEQVKNVDKFYPAKLQGDYCGVYAICERLRQRGVLSKGYDIEKQLVYYSLNENSSSCQVFEVTAE